MFVKTIKIKKKKTLTLGRTAVKLFDKIVLKWFVCIMKAIVFRPSATINRYYLPTFKLRRQFDNKKTEAENWTKGLMNILLFNF